MVHWYPVYGGYAIKKALKIYFAKDACEGLPYH